MRRRAVLATLMALALGPPATARAAAATAEIRVLSNRADLISGGDALVDVTLPAGATAQDARIVAAGRDVTSAFAARPDRRLIGLVTGLPLGRSSIVVRLRDGRGARLWVDDHPSTGPVFAGPQTQPWLCATKDNGLGPALDAACSAPTKVSYVYKSTNPLTRSFAAYDAKHPPADVAQTTTDDGRSVPFVVRYETGTMDRGIYAIAVLADPGKRWTALAPQPTWNGKVLWPFGGDCKPWHKQDAPVDPLGSYPLDLGLKDNSGVGFDETLGSVFGNGNALTALGRGFLVADSSMNKLGSQCNPVVSAEATMMLKEHVVETYGPIRYTIGAGSSGGSMQQHVIAGAYPGLLDGIQPMASFPDVWTQVVEAEDCHLLNHYFTVVSPHLWAVPGEREAVLGTFVSGACLLQQDGPQLGTPDVGSYSGTWMDPHFAQGCGLPAAQVYDARTNKDGVRCTLQDYMVSVMGRRASDGFANRAFDNVGVQYGLRALQAGRITPEQFVDLNARVGGIDIDWNIRAQRSVADGAALDASYAGGLVTDGRELANVPIVDIRGTDNVELHADFNTYVMRARLDRDAGGHGNQVVFTGARPVGGDPTSFRAAFDVIDDWLGRVEADRGPGPLAQKVVRDRPPRAVDSCWLEGRQVTDAATCAKAFPYYANSRIAAGLPFTDDVLKCRLKPLRRGDYHAQFTDEQWRRLERAFAGGVCEASVPGVGQQPVTPWTSYADGPGGRPLGPPPRSRPLGQRRRSHA